MRTKTYFIGFALVCGLLLMWGGRARAADEPAKVAGTWEMTFAGPMGTRTQTLKIQQDGSAIKGTITGRRGESPLEGSLTGNKISFTVTRETPNGTFKLDYTGTVDGDAMKGTVHSELFDGKWTAKRTTATGEK